MSHKPQEILFVTNDGLVMNSGYSNKLNKGVIALADKGGINTKDGIPLTNNPSKERNRKFEIRLGIADTTVSRNRSDKSYASRPFTLSDIVDIKVSAPSLKHEVDEVWMGYDGINADTAIILKNGETAIIDLVLEGEAFGALGYADSKVSIKHYITAPLEGSFTMQEIVEKAIAKLQNEKLYGNVALSEYVDIYPINSENTALVGTNYEIYELEVPMEGTSNNIAQVKHQYPTLDIKFDSEVNGKSKFVVAVENPTEESVKPANFNVKGTTITLTCDEYAGSTETNTAFAWVKVGDATAINKTFNITLFDDECEGNRLADLQAFYPELTITKGATTNCQTVYSTSVITNFVTSSCSHKVRDILVAEAPQPFEFVAWKIAPASYSASALMGIAFKGKEFVIAGGEHYRDTMPMTHNFTKLSVSGGYPFAQYKNFGEFNGEKGYFTVKWKTRGTRPEGLGMDYFALEENTRVYYTRQQRLCNNEFGNLLLGNESLLKPLSQYVMYTVQVKRGYFAQSFSQTNVEHFRYNILVEVGKHKNVEALVNSLATAAGLPTVKAYSAD